MTLKLLNISPIEIPPYFEFLSCSRFTTIYPSQVAPEDSFTLRAHLGPPCMRNNGCHFVRNSYMFRWNGGFWLVDINVSHDICCHLSSTYMCPLLQVCQQLWFYDRVARVARVMVGGRRWRAGGCSVHPISLLPTWREHPGIFNSHTFLQTPLAFRWALLEPFLKLRLEQTPIAACSSPVNIWKYEGYW